MKIDPRPLLRKLLFPLERELWNVRVRSARRLLHGRRAWQAMDLLGFPGFGLQVLRVDFLSGGDNVPAWGEGSRTFARLASILDRDAERQDARWAGCLSWAERILAWPRTPRPGSALPWLENEFFSPLDMAGLYGTIRDLRPARYVEIGGGISTRVALAAIADGNLPAEMICVDPAPRVALPSPAIRHWPRPLEAAVEDVAAAAVPGTVLFVDGSHYCFPGNDVAAFFLQLLPILPAGVVVHLHDIFLPGDYPADQARRYWSEQYLLAAWLLGGGGAGWEILLPGARLEMRPEPPAGPLPRLRAAHPGNRRFSSFWFRKI